MNPEVFCFALIYTVLVFYVFLKVSTSGFNRYQSMSIRLNLTGFIDSTENSNVLSNAVVVFYKNDWKLTKPLQQNQFYCINRIFHKS